MLKVTRREALGVTLEAAGVALAAAAGMTALVRQARSAAWAPPPPGATAHFTDLCVKCGLCVKACPFGTLKLAGIGDPAPAGTPYFVPRDVPCEMCEDNPCVRVCPSGALDRRMKDIKKAQMGIAAVDPVSCLSWQGLRCEVCWRVCPVRDKALTLVPHPRQISKHAVFVPTIDPDHCTGCGMCTKSCPTEVSAINILERKSFLGRIGEHYRLSWKTNQPHHPHIPAKDAAPQTAPVAPAGLDYLNSEEGL